MSSKVKAIPDGYHAVTPYLFVRGAIKAIEFYKQALGATEVMRVPGTEGRLMHAEIQIGDSRVMLADEFPEMSAFSPDSDKGGPSHICLYVEDVDGVVEQAKAAGATVLRPVQDQFYGDRSGTVRDPFGHDWTIATHVEDVSMEEIGRRMAQMSGR